MSLAIDNVKIKYSQEGYLPNYPHHLISDEEMCDAFINNEISYFYDNYPLVCEDLRDEYNALIDAIQYHISRFLSKDPEVQTDLPDWVYSYMLGHVVSVNSSQQDRHYWLVGLNRDNLDDVMDSNAQLACYEMSRKWVNKLQKSERQTTIDGEVFMTRPPTMFGEPHVIKQIRLYESKI